MASWVPDIENLSKIAKIHLQAAYSIFTHGQCSKWMFLMRSTPNKDELQPLEDTIRFHFLPVITGRQTFSDSKKKLMALTSRLGGLGICLSTENAASQKITEPLVDLILLLCSSYPLSSQADRPRSCQDFYSIHQLDHCKGPSRST